MTAEIKIKEKVATKLAPPNLWKVVFLNDDKTPMEFVIELLTVVFKHDLKSATAVTLEIHNTGSAVAGIYSHEVAEHKSIEAIQLSRSNGFPLQIKIEEE
jgi:ATP-dependent Clp protease adaptor protein ClpS